MNVSVAFKLTMARFVNSSLVLLIVNGNPATWFKAGDLVYDAQILIIILAITAPIMEIINIPGIVRWIKIRSQKAKEDEC
jgi:membrane protein YdbS with pleckstrin-like domain